MDPNSSIGQINVLASAGTVTDSGGYDALSTDVIGATVNLYSTVTGLGATTLSNGTLNLDASSPTATSLTQSGGALDDSGTLTVTGAAEFAGGAMSGEGTGTIDAAGGATLFTGVNEVITLTGETLELASASSTDFQIGSGSYPVLDLNSGSQLVIESGVTFTDQMIGSIRSNGGAAGSVVNDGTYVKNDGTTTIDVALNNSGTLDVESGTLNLNGSVASGGQLETAGGTLNVTTAVSGTGTVAIGGGGTAEFGSTFDQNVTFSGAGTLQLAHSQGTDYSGTISGFGPGDALDLRDLAFATSGEQLAWDSADHTLTVSGGGQSAALVLAGTYIQANFAVMGDSGGGTSGDATVTFVTQPPVLGGATSDTVAAGGPVTLGAIDLASSSADTLGTVTITGLAHDLTGFNGGTYTANTGTWTGTAAEFNALTFDAGAAGMSTLEISATTVGAAVPATRGLHPHGQSGFR